MLADRLKTTLVVCWLIISSFVLPALLAPVLVSPQLLAAMAPVCDRQIRTGEECGLCAAAGSMLLLYDGRMDAAVRRSGFGIPLLAALVWNEIVALLYTATEVQWFWVHLRRARQTVETEEYSCRP